ncbi:MAG: hypothetical protein MUF42_06115 [Cytophagaceae bacterium]|jgi:hypothetical protein|nr:hypothetical protein [Cytophagaceae bacterium]
MEPLPLWISISFLFVIPIPFLLLSLLVRRVSLQTAQPYIFPVVLIFFLVYLAYITWASKYGIFQQETFPPRVVLLATLPLAFVWFGFVIWTTSYKKFLEQVPLDSLVRIHGFRFIGVFFIILACYNRLPLGFALMAGLGDIFIAASSSWVAKAIKGKKSYAKKLTLIWNTIGALDILFTAIAANVLTLISMNSEELGVEVLAQFPFCIIPAFAPPTILFLHISIFKKLRKSSL